MHIGEGLQMLTPLMPTLKASMDEHNRLLWS